MDKSKLMVIAVIVIIICAIIGAGVSCSDNDSSYGEYDNGYSKDYNNDSDYKSNVDYISGIYGEDSKHVDDVFQALGDAMK